MAWCLVKDGDNFTSALRIRICASDCKYYQTIAGPAVTLQLRFSVSLSLAGYTGKTLKCSQLYQSESSNKKSNEQFLIRHWENTESSHKTVINSFFCVCLEALGKH